VVSFFRSLLGFSGNRELATMKSSTRHQVRVLVGSFLLLAFLGCASPPLYTQVSGTVTNWDGHPVNGLQIVIKTNEGESTTTVKEGNFLFPSIPPGSGLVYFKKPLKGNYTYPPNASPEAKKKVDEMNAQTTGVTGPVTQNVNDRYFHPSTSKLACEMKPGELTKLDLKLEK